MSTKHFEGPWTIETDEARGDDIYFPIRAGDGLVCLVDATPIDDPALPANARLIAAAPELLEALQGLINICTHPSATKEGMRQIAREARAAIAKATT